MNKQHAVFQALDPLWQVVSDLKAKKTSTDFRAQVEKTLKKVTVSLIGCTPFEVNHIQYAVVALIDELAMREDWIGRGAWMQRPLQVQYFQENMAGQGFFSRLEQLMQNPQPVKVVLQVYAYCLALGFQGQYRLNAQDRLLNIKEQVFSVTNEAKGHENRFSSVRSPKKRWPAIWSYVLAVLVCAIVLQGGFEWRLHARAKTITSLIQQKGHHEINSFAA